VKISISVANYDIGLPQIVFRGALEPIFRKVSGMGYQGVDLFLERLDGVDGRELRKLLDKYHLGVSMLAAPSDMVKEEITMGHPDPAVRREFFKRSEPQLRLASQIAAPVVIGYTRGYIKPGLTRNQLTDLFCDSLVDFHKMAEDFGTTLILEPINHHELNYINNVDEALEILHRLKLPRLRLMLDAYHMNIEEASIPLAIFKAREHLHYFQLVDSNRQAPGWGHTNLREVYLCLKEIGYSGFLGIEVVPVPDAEKAAVQGIEYVRMLMR